MMGRLLVAAVTVMASVALGMASPALAAATSTLNRTNPTFAQYPSNPAAFSGTGSFTATAILVDVQIPPSLMPNTSTSGCEATDFAGYLANTIAVLQRGTCTFAVKAANAKAAGALAVVIFNEGQPGRTDLFPASLGAPGIGLPVVVTSFAVGEELHLLRLNGLQLQVTVTDDAAQCAAPPAVGTAIGGRNVIVAQPGVTTNGTPAADVIYGTSGPDRINALDGDDIVFGFGGNDQLAGGNGADTLCGGDDADTLTGDAGADTLSGDSGNDDLVGGTGDDTLIGGDGTNRLIGSDGTDACSPGPAPSQAATCEGAT